MKEIKVKRLESIEEINDLKPLEDVVEVRVGPSIYYRFLGVYAGTTKEDIPSHGLAGGGIPNGTPMVITQRQDIFSANRELIYDNYLRNPVIEEGAIYVNDIPARETRPEDGSYEDKRTALMRSNLWNGELAPRPADTIDFEKPEGSLFRAAGTLGPMAYVLGKGFLGGKILESLMVEGPSAFDFIPDNLKAPIAFYLGVGALVEFIRAGANFPLGHRERSRGFYGLLPFEGSSLIKAFRRD